MKKLIVLATLSLAAGQASADRWSGDAHPHFFNPVMTTKMNFNLSALPEEAKLKDERFGWSETFWPSKKGGVAYRWNDPQALPFEKTKMMDEKTLRKTYFKSKEQLKMMTEEEIGKLSPAELYDISQEDYDYSLTRKVMKQYFPNDEWWEGICHGWALAAVNYAEPAPVTITNKHGIRVPFGASDVKGLLALHDAYNSNGYYVQIGKRCNVVGKIKGEEFEEDGKDVKFPTEQEILSVEKQLKEVGSCTDINAGAFHLVLANMIGVNSKGFVAEIDRLNDVWNQPVIGYSSKLGEAVALTANDKANGVAKKIKVTTAMTYGDELEFYSEEEARKGTIGFVTKEPVTGTPMQVNSVRNYEYILELDVSGNIIGGEWLSASRPDFIWTKAKDVSFRDGSGGSSFFGFGFGKKKVGFELKNLSKIYRPVQH
ncbi:MAG TPA: hypothetical protein VNJ01_11765 [Bacteriovoracaceae bacterium]|nr:hypothetical protein [Bacteriovoracaceae bacterium]